MKRNLLTVIIGLVLIVIFALLLFVFQVRQSEIAVVTTFGKPTRMAEPGPHLKWPWPIQKVYTFDQRIQNFSDKFSQTLTADNNNLIVTIYIGWKISDAKAFFPKFAGGSVSAAQQQLEGMLRSAKNAVIGKHTLSEFVNADPKELQFNAIEKEIEQAVQAQLQTNSYGIDLEFLGFKKIELEPGEKKTVALYITPDSLAFYDIDMKFVVEPGDFEIMLGNSSRDSDLQKVTLTVT